MDSDKIKEEIIIKTKESMDYDDMINRIVLYILNNYKKKE